MIFIVYKTNTIDIIKPTWEGVFKRVQEIKCNTLQNHKIFISDLDENYFYLRTLVNVYKPGDDQEIPIDLEEHDDINESKDIYRESIKKLKFTVDSSPMKKVKFEGTEYQMKMIEIGEYTVYSNEK
jgi:hypothetical protein